MDRIKKIKNALLEILDIKLDRAFGMDISDSSIEILELKMFLKFSVLTYGRIELEKGIVEDGKILNADALKIKIKELIGKVGPRKISTNKVMISLPESKVFLHFFNIDKTLKKQKLNDAVLKEAAKIIPINRAETYWDFEIKSSFTKEKKSVLYAGAQKKLIDMYLSLCADIGLEVVAVDVESLSIGRAILSKNEKTNLILDMGARTSIISIFDKNDDLNLSISVPIAGENFTQAIAEKLKVTRDEAEELKKKLGLQENTEPLDKILSEIKTAITYYESEYNEKVEELYLVGGSSLLAGLNVYLQNNLALKVNVINNFKNIPVFFTNVVGLAMRGATNKFKGINLVKNIGLAQTKAQIKFDLFRSGYIKKTTLIRALLNNRIFVMTIFTLSILLLIFVLYKNFYGL